MNLNTIHYHGVRYYSICRDGMGKKWLLHVPCTKSYVENSALDVVTSLYEPYQSFSSVFINNSTVSVARDHHWSTTPASR